MIQKTVTIHRLGDPEMARLDREYWLSRPSEERLAAVDFLRAQFFGTDQRLQRVVEVVQLPEC